MADKTSKDSILSLLKSRQVPLSLTEISSESATSVPERTLRRWLASWVEKGLVLRSGAKRSTRYMYRGKRSTPSLGFLQNIKEEQRVSLLKQLRDLWTHTSTALEGNTLSLGDTHFVLEEGLTISGKPLKDHHEVVGHARAIDLLYQCIHEPLADQHIFDLHTAVQTEVVVDIFRPNGAWKTEANGTYVVTRNNQQVYIEYALPDVVPCLMQEVINTINDMNFVQPDNAAFAYAKIHTGIAHIHPFWDGNGRIARLLANIPLLKSGLPPLLIPVEERRTYIQILAEYESAVGQLTRETGVWPDEQLLIEFTDFCKTQYASTKLLLDKYR